MWTSSARFARAGVSAATLVGLLYGALYGMVPVRQPADRLAVVRMDMDAHLANGGWNYDRYKRIRKLDRHTTITVADLRGPGIIRQLHITRHVPKEVMARGIVLEIWFDNAREPAVQCPLADFFGDGCNGSSMPFSSNLLECAPWCYNAFFGMPFRSRARILLRNDTDLDAMDYSAVEWESLPAWDSSLGYFHATYRRQCFQLTPHTDQDVFDVEGSGHLVGRQYSITTDEPIFRDFIYLMEGNNEVDIDGQTRAIDYLGIEDSFGFSWGFQAPFAGQHAGMTLVDRGMPRRVSVFRLHDAMPIRFRSRLRWHINWREERMFTGKPEWASAVNRGGCWVDLASVHYWYQNDPGGYRHAPIESIPDRQRAMLKPAWAGTGGTVGNKSLCARAGLRAARASLRSVP